MPPIIPITGEALNISVVAKQSDDKQTLEHKICISNTSNSEVKILTMQSTFTKDERGWGAEHGIDYRFQDQFLIKPNQTVCKEKQLKIMVEDAAIIKNIVSIDFIQTEQDAKNEEMPSISIEKELYFELIPQSTETPTATDTTSITLTPLFTTTQTSTPCQMMSPAPESTPTMPPLPLPVLITSTSPIMPTSTIIMITPEATLGISETPTPSITSTASITPSPTATIPIDLSTTPTNPPPP